VLRFYVHISNYSIRNINIFFITIVVYAILFGCLYNNVIAADRINKIHIETKEVFESTDKDWFFASPFLNSLHGLTKSYIIEDELLFKEGDDLFEDDFLETERNLNFIGLFTDISIELEEVSGGLFDVYVTTKDRWSLYPSIIVGANGGEYYLGGRMKDYNLFGHGIMLDVDANYVYRNDTTGYEGMIELEKKRLFRTEMNLFIQAFKTYLRTAENIKFEKPFRTNNTRTAFGISASNTSGNDYFVNKKSLLFNGARIDSTNNPELASYIDTLKFINTNEQKVQLWYAKSWLSNDKVYISALLEWQQANRNKDALGYSLFDRAFDNQSKLLVGFSSVAQTFYSIYNTNSYSNEDIAVGGWGDVVLGAIFPSNKYGEKGLFYIGVQAEKSIYSKDFYLFGQVAASSSFSNDFAKYTYQEFLALCFIRLNSNLTLATRLYEQATWNYPRMRQLLMDDIRGVRGYEMQGLAGDNRLIANIELRYFPDFRISVMQFSAVAFFDIGSVWNQRVEDAFLNSRFYSSVGIGIRGHFTKSNNPDHILRIDIPYNFATRHFGISLGVQQYFSAFSSHKFKLPAIYSSDYHYE
jgi:hypothetical protein